jgi:hypothetical protein
VIILSTNSTIATCTAPTLHPNLHRRPTSSPPTRCSRLGCFLFLEERSLSDRPANATTTTTTTTTPESLQRPHRITPNPPVWQALFFALFLCRIHTSRVLNPVLTGSFLLLPACRPQQHSALWPSVEHPSAGSTNHPPGVLVPISAHLFWRFKAEPHRNCTRRHLQTPPTETEYPCSFPPASVAAARQKHISCHPWPPRHRSRRSRMPRRARHPSQSPSLAAPHLDRLPRSPHSLPAPAPLPRLDMRLRGLITSSPPRRRPHPSRPRP